MRAGRRTTMLKRDATMNPATCNPIPSPANAASKATSAPSEKKSKKKETERSSPAKARAASTAQKTMSRFSKLRPPRHQFYTTPGGIVAPCPRVQSSHAPDPVAHHTVGTRGQNWERSLSMTPGQHYDAVVVGSGQGGNPLARALAGSGRKTAVVEREHVGGTCINEGCTPTKTMIASAKVAYLDRRSADYGVKNGPVTVDMVRVRQRKRDMVDSFRAGDERRLAGAGIDLIRGEASFVAPKELEVRLNGGETLQLTSDAIFLNVGARPASPPIEGLDSVPTLNSTTIMELDQMYRRFGSEVTVVQRGPQLLSREDADVAEAVAEVLREDSVEVLLRTEAQSAGHEGGKIQLQVHTPDGDRTLSGSHLLAATGRTPNTARLNLEAAGVQADEHGFIEVNE